MALFFASAFLSGIAAGITEMCTRSIHLKTSSDGVKYREQANRAYAQANVFLAIAGLMWSSSVVDSWLTGEAIIMLIQSDTVMQWRRHHEAFIGLVHSVLDALPLTQRIPLIRTPRESFSFMYRRWLITSLLNSMHL